MYVIVETLTGAYKRQHLFFFLERIHLPLPSEQGLQAVQTSKDLEGLYQIEPFQVLSKN